MKIFVLAAALAISSATARAGADLSIAPITFPSPILSGSTLGIGFLLRNIGDTAKDVVLTISATGGVTTRCESGCLVRAEVPPGSQFVFDPFGTEFDNPGDVTITASVSSSTPDPNPDNNKTSVILTVSPDPDLAVTITRAPSKADLGAAFSLGISIENGSLITAHDVDLTVDFRSDVGVSVLPAGCRSAEAGRVVCHYDVVPGSVPPQPQVTLGLVAPAAYGDGAITFTATATSREPDFNPKSNTATAFTPLILSFFVTSTANDGSGSLRQAILDANAAETSGPINIVFRIQEPSANRWKTIAITSPLPAVTTSNIQIDGATQSSFFGATNPDGPDIEISGGGIVDGDGLFLEGCSALVANLTINGFERNGVSASDSVRAENCHASAELHHLFIGTDPTGSEARPNGQRGIGISLSNGTDINHLIGGVNVHDCVISGNTRSGIFALTGLMLIVGNRIGVKAHSDEPLPNGNSGIFLGPGCWGSSVGGDVLTPARPGNVIAFNGEMGVAIDGRVKNVSLRGNRIWSNGLLGIDIGLDGPTLTTKSENGTTITAPTLTLAHYDPVSQKTIVEGEATNWFAIDLYANDIGEHSGFGEGQRPVASITETFSTPSAPHFRIEIPGDLTGQYISATATLVHFVGFAKPEGFDQGFLSQTSEFSQWLEVR